MDFFSMFAEQIINGLRMGAIYALIALGYTMVYGIAKMINFAHGDIIMVSAYLLYLFGTGGLSLPVPLVIILTIISCALIGVFLERVAYKPLRSAPPIAVLITAIGVSFFLQNFVLIVMGATPIPFPALIKIPSIKFAGITVPGIAIVTLVVTIICMTALVLFVGRTKTGAAMRAVSEDKGAAALMGINVNKTISITFAIGSALAAVAGLLFISQFETLMPTLGAMPGIKAFVAAVLGGIGSIPGAIIGGILLGVIESLAKTYSAELAEAISFAVLVIVLLVRPAGLMGKLRNEKV